jgi:GT2 family glycosyltransferase
MNGPTQAHVDVSVIIVSYNTRPLTLRCIEALRETATDDVATEVIVVDNDSADGSADAIVEGHPDVRLIRLPGNVGWGRAVNRGAEASNAEYLLLLNPDAEPVGPAVAQLVRFARTHPDHGLYTGRTVGVDGTDDRHSCLGLPSLWSCFGFATGLSTLLHAHAWANPEILPGYDRRTVREVPAISGTAMLVRRELFLRLRGFCPQYFMYSEDVDLSVRAAALGARPVLYPHAAFVHLGGASSSPVGQRVRLLRGKVTYFRVHWSRARARWGTRLLVTGVALRAAAGAAVATRGRRSTDWVAVWRQRRDWAAGWPPLDEARPGDQMPYGDGARPSDGARPGAGLDDLANLR